MIVGLVAAPEHPLPLANAVPMVMGANIGTTVTSTLVSLGHIGRRSEFERAFPVAICHDVFNYGAVLVLLPLELVTGYLRHSALALGGLVEGVGGGTYQSPIAAAIGGGLRPIELLSDTLFRTQSGQAVFLILVSGMLIVLTLYLLVTVMRAAVHSRVQGIVTDVLGSNAVLAMVIGAVVTVMVQSSSITTSLLVPLAGAGLLRLEQAFPVTLGANVGTTVTAFIASLAVSGPNATAGLEIALVHLLFNLSGIVLVYPVVTIRRLPLAAARALTRLALRSRTTTIIWMAAVFYGIPGLVLLIDRWLK
jgi:sodium-dependent phosphate cotransporter